MMSTSKYKQYQTSSLEMPTSESSSSHELLQAQAQSWNHIFSYITPFAVSCAVQLDIPDVLHKHDKPMSLSDLSAQLPNIDPSKVSFLPSLMRFLVHSGFLDQHLDDENHKCYYYSLSPAGRLFVRNEPLNDRSLLFINQDLIYLKAWFELGNWFQNDSSYPTAFHTAHGKSFWDFINDAKQKKYGSNFNDAMTSDSRFITNVLISECNKHIFEGLTSLVDVGGGTGTLATAIAKAYPTIKCTVLDLPHVLGDLKENGHENLKFVGGSMFDEIPQANAILLKWILHNWSDEDCVKILKKCKESISSKDKGGKVIIIDVVMMEDDDPKQISQEFVRAQHFMDLLMMVNFAAKERTKKEWEKLFTQAGFSEYKIFPTMGSRSIIEIYP